MSFRACLCLCVSVCLCVVIACMMRIGGCWRPVLALEWNVAHSFAAATTTRSVARPSRPPPPVAQYSIYSLSHVLAWHVVGVCCRGLFVSCVLCSSGAIAQFVDRIEAVVQKRGRGGHAVGSEVRRPCCD